MKRRMMLTTAAAAAAFAGRPARAADKPLRIAC